MSEPLDAFWSVPAADVLRQLEATPRGLTSAEAERRLDARRPQRPAAEEANGRADPPARPVQEPAHPDPPVRGRPVLLPARLRRRARSSSASSWPAACWGSGRSAAPPTRSRSCWPSCRRRRRCCGTARRRRSRSRRSCRATSWSCPPARAFPGDCLVLESNDLFVDEATLTGETYPVEKTAGTVAADAPLGQRTNTLFMGTHVVSGSAAAVVVRTGTATEFGKVSERLRLRRRRPSSSAASGASGTC